MPESQEVHANFTNPLSRITVEVIVQETHTNYALVMKEVLRRVVIQLMVATFVVRATTRKKLARRRRANGAIAHKPVLQICQKNRNSYY